MSFINLKWSDGDKSLDLEMKDYNEDVLKLILDTLVLQKKDPSLEQWKEGYQAFMNSNSNDESEYIASPEKGISFNEAAATHEDEKKQCYYICSCGYKGKHFIGCHRTFVTCHRCQEKMMVRNATSKGPEFQDDFGNYYIAGEYKRSLRDKEEEEKFWLEQENKALVPI